MQPFDGCQNIYMWNRNVMLMDKFGSSAKRLYARCLNIGMSQSAEAFEGNYSVPFLKNLSEA